VFQLSRPLARLPFFAGLCAMNAAIIVSASAALTILPSGAGHLAVLTVMGALHAGWFLLHARRFADAGRSAVWPFGVTLAGFSSFAVGYLLIAALWSVPEVQEAAFRTAGGVGGGYSAHVETNQLVIDAGRAVAALLGAAGSLLVTGIVAASLAIVAAFSAAFSIVSLLLPGGRAQPAPPRLTAATRALHGR